MKSVLAPLLTAASLGIFSVASAPSRAQDCSTKQDSSAISVAPASAGFLSETEEANAEANHRYTEADLVAMFKRPTTVPALLKNLQLAWTKRLLVQPAFYSDAALLQVFNAVAVTWKNGESTLPKSPSAFTGRNAATTLDSSVFPNASVKVMRVAASISAMQSAACYFPAQTQETDIVEINVEAIPGFTWGAVDAVFRPDSKAARVLPYVTVLPHHAPDLTDGAQYQSVQPDPWPGDKLIAYYLHPGELPPGEDVSKHPGGFHTNGPRLGYVDDFPSAGFLLRQGTPPRSDGIASIVHTINLERPEDFDQVKTVIIREDVRIVGDSYEFGPATWLPRKHIGTSSGSP